MSHLIRDRRPPARVAAVLAVTALLLSGASPAAAATPFGTNLVMNPRAEAGAGTNGYSTVAIPSWVNSGKATVVRYGSPGFPTKAESRRIGGGKKFFSCGPDTDFAYLFQDIMLKGRAGPIDAGLIRVKIQARIAGFGNGTDTGFMRVTFSDAADHETGQRTTGETKGTFGLFQLKTASAIIPAGTRRMTVVLQGLRADDGGTYCDAYFDNVSAVLKLVN